MTRHARDLPTGQVAENAFGERIALLLQSRDLVANVQRVVIAYQTQLFNFGLQVSNRLFEIQKIRVHRHPSWVDGQEAGRLIRKRHTIKDLASCGRD